MAKTGESLPLLSPIAPPGYRAAHPTAGRPIPECARFAGAPRTSNPITLTVTRATQTPENQLWACRSCNVKAGFILRELGIGRITRQFNPNNQGAQTLSQWVAAVLSLKGESDVMDVESALAMVSRHA